jgi:surface protein
MSLSLGNTNFGSLYLGSTKIAEAYLGSVKVFPSSPVDPYNPLNLPYYTVRAQFTEGYTPTASGSATQVSSSPNVWDLTYNGNIWTELFKNNTDLLAVLGANTHGQYMNVEDMSSMFEGCTNLTSVALFDTSSVYVMNNMFFNCKSITTLPDFDTTSCWNFVQMFYNCSALLACPNISTTYRSQYTTLTVSRMFEKCTSLASVPLLDLNGATSTELMFSACRSLQSVPLFDLSTVTDAQSMFSGCTALTEIPAFNLSAVTNANAMFHNCSSVTTGTLAAYQQLSASPVATHNVNTFGGAGPASDLAQIPATWGGTMREWQNDYYIEIIPTTLSRNVAFGKFYTNGLRQSVTSAQIKDGSWISLSSYTVDNLNNNVNYVYMDVVDGFRTYFTKAADLTSLQYSSSGATIGVNITVYGKRVGSSSWSTVATKSATQGGTISITV